MSILSEQVPTPDRTTVEIVIQYLAHENPCLPLNLRLVEVLVPQGIEEPARKMITPTRLSAYRSGVDLIAVMGAGFNGLTLNVPIQDQGVTEVLEQL